MSSALDNKNLLSHSRACRISISWGVTLQIYCGLLSSAVSFDELAPHKIYMCKDKHQHDLRPSEYNMFDVRARNRQAWKTSKRIKLNHNSNWIQKKKTGHNTMWRHLSRVREQPELRHASTGPKISQQYRWQMKRDWLHLLILTNALAALKMLDCARKTNPETGEDCCFNIVWTAWMPKMMLHQGRQFSSQLRHCTKSLVCACRKTCVHKCGFHRVCGRDLNVESKCGGISIRSLRERERGIVVEVEVEVGVHTEVNAVLTK